MTPEVCVIRTGSANLASVVAALRRIGASVRITTDPDVVRGADRLVLPGVGAFGAAMDRLRQEGLVPAIRNHVNAERPFLAICLGLQLLGPSSEESPGVAGLGLVDTPVTRFPDGLIVPQLGWNLVEPSAGCRLLQRGYAYYANSYRMLTVPSGWQGAVSVHGAPFVAAMEKGPMLACQFHPELSGAWGKALLERWLAASADVGAVSC